MDFLQAFERMMAEQGEIALASCVENQPNVRIVNFYYDARRPGIVYFATFGDNPKVEEFAKNNCVAFSTVPHQSNEHIRVTRATVHKSGFTIFDLQDEFSRKIPGYEMTIQQVGSLLVLFEIHFQEATVTIDFTQSGTVRLEPEKESSQPS